MRTRAQHLQAAPRELTCDGQLVTYGRPRVSHAARTAMLAEGNRLVHYRQLTSVTLPCRAHSICVQHYTSCTACQTRSTVTLRPEIEIGAGLQSAVPQYASLRWHVRTRQDCRAYRDCRQIAETAGARLLRQSDTAS